MAKIQVILLEDVAGQGRKGEIITVSDGYAHNFLFKNKKAILASEEELKKIENKRKKEEKKYEEERKKYLVIKEEIEKKLLKLAVKSGENGKLFGAITNKEISTLIKEELNFDIDRKKIECNIKTLGRHEVVLKLFTDVKAILNVEVSPK